MNKEQEDLALLGIKISTNVKEKLDKLKIHPREPYTEVIQRLIDYMDQQELTSHEK